MAGKDPKYPLRPEGADVSGPMKESIAALGKLITDRIPIKLGLKKVTKDDPEYWAVRILCDDDEKIAQFVIDNFRQIRKPKTFAQLKASSGLSDEELTRILDRISYTGLVEYNWENEQHEKQWVLPMFVPGSGEFSNMNLDLIDEHPELGMFFEHMTRLPLEKVTPMVPPGGAGIGMHVIPVQKEVDMCSESVSIEKISHWLDKYDGKYAASPCSCRRSRMTYEEGCGDDFHDWCIAIGDMADYVVQTGKGGRYITREEALEILRKGEENGFVHQITNIDGEDKIFAICNCNVNVCYALRTSQLFNTPNMSRSAYAAHIDKNKCVACGRCVEVCPAGALSLGQKLCRKNGEAVKYPKALLPTDKPWSKEDWDWDYRDNNRIETHESGTAPCKSACPAHIAVQGYLKLAAQGRYTDALALIKKNNPLPAVCGHICNRRCEDACTRGSIDRAVAIDEVKKFIAMQDLDAETRYIPPKIIPRVQGEFGEKIAIIGAGPAGLSCAYYLAEKGYRPTVFDRNEKPGGMLVYGIPSYKLEKNVIDAEIDIIRQLGVEFRCGVEVGKDITIGELRKEGYKAFYIAIGCQGGRSVGVKGEEGPGVISAVDFLREINARESYDFGGDVVIIGGGNVAIDCSRDAVRAGAEHVYQYSLETRETMPASADEIEEALKDGVVLNGGWGPKEILRDDHGAVKGIVLKRCISVKDQEGRFRPQYDENETVTVPCAAVVLAVGQSIVWGDLLAGTNVKLGAGMGALCDPVTYQTAEPDIFVGGDVYTGPRFVIDAIAAGKEAAISLHRFVQPHTSLTIGRNPNYYRELDKDDILVESYDNSSRQIPGTDRSKTRSFRDAKLPFTKEQVAKETGRCLSCGATIVDENQCVGCGLCTTRCEFDAIHLHRDNPECSTMRKSEDKLKYVLPYGMKQAIKVRFKGRKEPEWR